MRRGQRTSGMSEPVTVELVAGKGSQDRGGGPGGYYWHIYTEGNRAGYVCINCIDEPPIGRHTSIQIHINQNMRGKGIGSVAYRLACEMSNYNQVFAHMRKSNVASQRAAENAGFCPFDCPGFRQHVMVWTRCNSLPKTIDNGLVMPTKTFAKKAKAEAFHQACQKS